MVSAERLKLDIEKAFGDAEFPGHLGIKAAEAMDDWVTDEDKLRAITEREDFHGPWQKVPKEHIQGNSLGFNYLDAKGVVYYLPAFMMLALENPTYANIKCAIDILWPGPENQSNEQNEHFCQKFSEIRGPKRAVCKDFLKYIESIMPVMNFYDDGYIDEVVSHQYWAD